MPPTSFDFNRALEALKAETPPQVPTAGVVLSSGRPHTRARRMRLVLVGGATFLALGLLWPRGTANVAFAQVKEQLVSQDRMHIITRYKFKRGGHTESWIDGDKYAHYMALPGPKPIFTTISDGTYVISFMDLGENRNGMPKTAFRMKASGASRGRFYLGPFGPKANVVDELIKAESLKVLGQKSISTDKGQIIQYRVQNVRSEPMLVYADPKTKLISKIEMLSNKGAIAAVTEIEYPASIDPSVFKFNVPGVTVRDIKDVRDEVTENLKNGLGTKTVAGKTITLRSVLYARDGGLWVLWTGGAPRGDLQYPVRVQGFPTPKVLTHSFPVRQPIVNAFGHKAFTVGGAAAGIGKPSPVVGERLGGMGIGLKDQKFQKVTLIVPVLDSTGAKKLGEARFENVPVVRIHTIYDFTDILGIR